jgi:hypothetical protein
MNMKQGGFRMARYNRVVSNIEKCFRLYHDKDSVSELTFHTIKQWMNSNTKDGITSCGLANLLRRRQQFRRVRTERKVGTNITTSFWTMTTLPPELVEVRKGWTVINEPPQTQ